MPRSRGGQMLGAAVVAFLAIGSTAMLAGLWSWLNLAADQPFAFIRSGTFIEQPSPYHVRLRAAEYRAYDGDRFFFQWWNYLIVDSHTRTKYQLVFQLNYHSSRAEVGSEQYLIVGAKGYSDNGGDVQASDSLPLQSVTLSGDMDILTPFYTQAALDNDTYLLRASFPASHTSSGQPLSFSLLIRRVHGMYAGLENEANDIRDCYCTSAQFAFNSRVTGWWSSSPSQNVSFTEEGSRYRAYGGASWGCQLPHKNSDKLAAVDYPWSWVWFSIPAADTRPEFSLTIGTGTFDTILGKLHAGISAMGWGDNIVGAAFVNAFVEWPFQLPLAAVSNDGYVAEFTPTFTRWTHSSNSSPSASLGSYILPLTQTYTLTTANYSLHVTAQTNLADYFRVPLPVEDVKDGRMRLYSDFRAERVDVQVKLLRRGKEGAANEVLYDGAAIMSALEFAYEAELIDGAAGTLQKLISSPNLRHRLLE